MTSERLRMLATVLEIESDFLGECARCGAIRLEDPPEGRTEVSASEQARLLCGLVLKECQV